MMHRIRSTYAGFALLAALGTTYCALHSLAADKEGDVEKVIPQNKVAKFMRVKLESSQGVLEGLVTEDFDQIKQGADKMATMSKATEWQVIQGPVYAQYSAEFRRSCKQLAKMAKDKNLDGAALSYMHLTLTCISCHKHVHSTKIAAGDEISPALKLALQRDGLRSSEQGRQLATETNKSASAR